LCGDERIVRFREVAVYRAAEVASVTLRVEEAGSLAFDDDWSDGSAGSHVCLLARAAIVSPASAELLSVVLIRSGLVLLLLWLLLLVPAALTVTIAMPKSAESSAALTAAFVAAVLASRLAAFRATASGYTPRCVRLTVLRRPSVSLRFPGHQ
jgi:hypothetical protein